MIVQVITCDNIYIYNLYIYIYYRSCLWPSEVINSSHKKEICGSVFVINGINLFTVLS